MNILSLVKGEPRWSMIDNNTWGMILGKSGKLPGELDPEIIQLAKDKGLEFTTEDPQKYYPDQLDQYRKEMDENGSSNSQCTTANTVTTSREWPNNASSQTSRKPKMHAWQKTDTALKTS